MASDRSRNRRAASEVIAGDRRRRLRSGGCMPMGAAPAAAAPRRLLVAAATQRTANRCLSSAEIRGQVFGPGLCHALSSLPEHGQSLAVCGVGWGMFVPARHRRKRSVKGPAEALTFSLGREALLRRDEATDEPAGEQDERRQDQRRHQAAHEPSQEGGIERRHRKLRQLLAALDHPVPAGMCHEGRQV